MARVTNTLIGKSSGKVGGAVFSTWKGINVLKEKGVPSNPQTDAQMQQRLKMALFVAVYQQAAPAFKAGFKEMAIKKSEFNAFISEAFQQEAFTGVYPAYAVDASKLLASKGSLLPTLIDSIACDISALEVTVDFEASASGNQSVLDEPVLVVYNKDKGLWTANSEGTRAAGVITCTNPVGSEVGDEVWGFLFFVQPSSGKVSTSWSEMTVAVA